MTTRTYKRRPRFALATTGAAEAVPLLTRMRRRILRWLELSRQRAALAELDDRLLKDVGLDTAKAKQEAARWFWDDPHRHV